MQAKLSATQWYTKGELSSYVRMRKSSGGILNMLELERPGGDHPHPPLADLCLHHLLKSSGRVYGNSGGGFFDTRGALGDIFRSAPNFDELILVEESHTLQSLTFPSMHWESLPGEATKGGFSVDCLQLY
jgi:AraC family transcriptional regulator